MNRQDNKLKTLSAEYADYLAKWKAEGRPTLTFTTPCCEKSLETPSPEVEETWDSMTNCIHCGELFLKVVNKQQAVGIIPGRT